MGYSAQKSAKNVATVLCIGQEQSGKTSLLYTMKLGQNLDSGKKKGIHDKEVDYLKGNLKLNPNPTIGFNRSTIQLTSKLTV